MNKLERQLEPFLPENTASYVANYIKDKKVKLRIAKPRATKLGDYRPPFKNSTHRISVNGNLNRFAFFITLIHEFAHLETFEQFRNKVKPHGIEWKTAFQKLMIPFIDQHTFPKPVSTALRNYMNNPAASSCTDHNLVKVLKRYDPENDSTLLDDIPTGEVFSFRSRKFQKKEKLRTLYKCIDLDNKRTYLINGLAEVELLSNEMQ